MAPRAGDYQRDLVADYKVAESAVGTAVGAACRAAIRRAHAAETLLLALASDHPQLREFIDELSQVHHHH